MKKWVIFGATLGIAAYFLIVALQKNVEKIREEKQQRHAAEQATGIDEEPSVMTEIPAQPLPKSIEERIAEQKKALENPVQEPGQEESPTVQPEVPAPAVPAVPEKKIPFIEGSFEAIRLYREANQYFLNENIEEAEKSFNRALDSASFSQAFSAEEIKIKELLVDASRARLDSLQRFYKVSSTAEPVSFTPQELEQNLNYLKGANEYISQALREMNQLIHSGSDAGKIENYETLSAELQENSKGILVLEKKSQS